MSDPSLMPLIKRLPTRTYWKRRPGKHPTHIKRKLTKQQLRDHLQGLYAIGLSPIVPGQDTTRVALFDVDNHSDDDVPVRRTVGELVNAAREYGLEATVFTSSGGKGAHVYFVWDDAQDARSVRALLVQVLEDCLLLPGTGGLEKNQVEVFPKQDSVPADGYGSMFILPYAFDSEWLVGAWQASQSVPLVAREDSHDSLDAGEVDLALLQSAVAALPNADVDYDEWRNTVFAIHAASNGSDVGLELACVWSSKSDKHDEDFLRMRVWPYVKAGRGITARTLLAKAREAGWQDDVLAAFDDLEKAAPGEQVPVVENTEDSATPDAEASAGGSAREVMLPAFQRDNNGRIDATVGNLEAALRAAMAGSELGFDAFTQQVMARRDGEWIALRDTDSIAMRIQLERRGFKPIAKEAFRDVLLMVAEETTFDSAQDWLYALEWDGTARVDAFLHRYFGTDDVAYHTAVSRYWWTAMAGRVCVPGLQTDMVPVLVGPQGSGKSTALVRMVPAREQLIEVDLMARDADLSRIMQGALIGEIAELRGLHSREDEHIKALISRTQEKWVPKYREYPRVFDRRLTFVGTTNHQEFLSDHTGNRRWLPVSIGKIDRDAISADRDQLWAEAHHLYEAHGLIYQQAEKLAKFAHSDFEIHDPWEDLIARYLADCESDFRTDYVLGVGDALTVTSNDVLVMSGAMPDVGRINRGHQMRLARILHNLGWQQTKFWNNDLKKQMRGWQRIKDELV